MSYHSERLPYVVPVLKAVLLILLFMCLLLLILYLSGEWLPTYDLHITSVTVCTSQSELTPQSLITTKTTSLYICGKAEGTTFRNTDFLLFRDNALIYREEYRLEPGEFFFQLPLDDLKLSSGSYRIDAAFGRSVIAQSTFEVSEP